jgi:hypothetical protein
MADVAISVRHEGASASFEFTSSTGSPPQVSNVLVLDHPHTEELWEIRSVAWKDASANGEANLQERLGAAGGTVPEGMDPLADFLSPDPRYRIAKEITDGGFSGASTDLLSLKYGVVPAGFEQTIPKQGAAAALEPGRTYRLVVLGRDFGSLIFAVAAEKDRPQNNKMQRTRRG